MFFFFIAPATTEIYTLSLHDALPISLLRIFARLIAVTFYRLRCEGREHWPATGGGLVCSNHQSFFDPPLVGIDRKSTRLNSSHSQISYAVFCLKKKIKSSDHTHKLGI